MIKTTVKTSLQKMGTLLFAVLMLTGLSAMSAQAQDAQVDNQNVLVLTLKDGDVKIRLRPDLAPEHVAQIKQLVRDGAYDNVVFHRVIDGFMAQTGDVQFGKVDNFNARRVGTGGSQYGNIRAEFTDTPFERGTVGMARSQNPNSANSQFFICLDEAGFLNGQYTVIGQVFEGMDVVDQIKKGDRAANGAVEQPDHIIKATLTVDNL